ncbi:hypothetical protein HMPREF9163_01515 [Selenomonas sp. oral taxon 138 str. F0429]|nr:hypothetical protein HMPREF9163_01515 [Selenomonas sp. oral taxon 138 str. F0429]
MQCSFTMQILYGSPAVRNVFQSIFFLPVTAKDRKIKYRKH